MFGLGERVQLGFFTIPNQPRELLYGEFSYQQPVGSEGTTLTATASASLVDPGASLAALDTEGQSTRFSLRATHPILRARGGNLSVSGSIDILDVGEDRLGVTNFDDHLRVFRVGLDYLRDDSWDGTTTVAVEVSQGIDILGASNAGDTALSRPDGDGVFTKVTAKLTRTQQIGQEFSIWAAIKGQISADPLLSAEEFSLGGSEFGRAYDFSEITGEDGIAGSVELRYGKSLNQEILKAFQIYGFYDLGAVWNDDTQGDSRESLASAGAGLRLTLPQSIFATAEVAKPLTRTVSTTGDQDWRAFFSLSANF
jgi:hemolysin activation/secretion protein